MAKILKIDRALYEVDDETQNMHVFRKKSELGKSERRGKQAKQKAHRRIHKNLQRRNKEGFQIQE